MEVDSVVAESVVNIADNVSKYNDDQLENHNDIQQAELQINNENIINKSNSPSEIQFKKPVLIIGPRRGKIGTTRSISNDNSSIIPTPSTSNIDDKNATNSTIANLETEAIDTTSEEKSQLPLPYREPSWSGIPNDKYKIEVLKSGVILNTIDLNEQSFYVIGRLPICDITLAHPTISRYHAILQYRSVGDEKNTSGYYIYDLESTHGTFWNGCRIKPKHYVKLNCGHMIKFGCSQRKLIFHTPPDEIEEESEYSVTELKEMRRLEILKREEEVRERKAQIEELKRINDEKEEANGINWGMGEDADEESDTSENPYALTANEELFLDDPKKTLRGWFEREGFDMQYQTEEKGIGQFLCWIDLPIDNATGRSVKAEALVKGKKKESVIQCALEACRILDRQGLLRQATHEGKKRKLRNWEEEDYYDSDEDNFLDRTGTIERKREQRMRVAGKLETKIETYTTLVEKHSVIIMEITKIQNTLMNHEKAKDAMNDNSNEDALDAFMSNLSSVLLNKADIIKMKSQLQNLRKEEEKLKKLIDIAKPANLPSLNLSKQSQPIIKFNESCAKKFKSHNDKCQRIDNENSVEHLVPNKGQYGLIKKNDTVTIENENIKENCNIHDEEEEKIETILNLNIENGGNNSINDTKTDEIKVNESEILRRKKRNMRRSQQRAEKMSKEIEKGYDENIYREDYSMWVPPKNQSGDGKTNLNDKLGY